MANLGYISLLVALGLSLYAVGALFFGARRRLPELVESGRNAALATTALVVIAFFALEYLLIVQDFSIAYVADQTSIGQPLFYTITGVWGGQAGSLLFWSFLLSLYTVATFWFHRDDSPRLMPYVLAVMMFVQVFFLIVLNFEAQPFKHLEFVPADGRGLNPLLQNPSMVMHPPMLYAGFVGFTVPFAFAIGGLLSGRLSAGWIRLSRRWTLLAWMFLSIGILLGANWAYNELGWGGYWAWDPVENASLMPWLVGTAFLHSVIVQEQRGMFKVWNIVLITLTYVLSIFGTFLTRSGVLESIHAFAVSNIGTYFLSFIAILLLGSFALLYDRLKLLKSERELDALVSRESAFLLNNLIFLGIWFAVFWGTIYPIVSETLTGRRVVVGPPYFNQVAGPLMMVLLLVMGVAPLLPWRRASMDKLKRNLTMPLIGGLLTAGVLAVFGVRRPVVLLSLGIAGFVAAGHLMEFWRGWKAQNARSDASAAGALFELIEKNRRRYGGYIIHLGVVLLAIGIVGSTFYEQVKDITLEPGQRAAVGTYEIEFLGLQSSRNDIKERVAAPLHVWKGEQRLGGLTPALDFHFKVPGGQRETEVAVRTTPVEDFYVVLTGVYDDGSATFKIFINPLVMWVWIGGIVLIFGTWVAIWPDPREERILERIRARDMAYAG